MKSDQVAKKLPSLFQAFPCSFYGLKLKDAELNSAIVEQNANWRGNCVKVLVQMIRGGVSSTLTQF